MQSMLWWEVEVTETYIALKGYSILNVGGSLKQ